MTSIGLITLLRQATQAARQGDASTFAEIRASIETLDRLGEISRQELDLLDIIATARMGDTARANVLVQRFGSLSNDQQHELFNGLENCPEMAHERFREFVLELRIAARAPRRRPSFFRSRALSVFLGVLTILCSGTAFVLIEFILPKSAVINTKNILTSISQADTRLLANSLPRSWQSALHNAALRIANSPADPGANNAALQKAFRNLQAALLAAHKSGQAKNIVKSLVGATDETDVLPRLAAGVEEISKSDWINVWTWNARLPWEINLSPNAVLVWRTVLAHAPIAQWSDNMFHKNALIDPLQRHDYFVSTTSVQPPKTLVQVQYQDFSWQLACVQVDGAWVPVDWSQDWTKYEPWISGKNSPAYPLSQLETTLADQINGVAYWLTRYTNSSSVTLPTEKEASWWIAQ